MHAPSPRARKIAGLSAAPIDVLVAGVMVWQGSTAAFTATTRNAGNSWATGQVALTDDDAGRAGFTVENLVPGATGEKCIEVTSNSTVAGEVRAYTQNLSGSAAGLEDHIDLRVERGTGGSFESCDGFAPVPGALPAQSLTTLSQANRDYATGGAVWGTEGRAGESSTYRGTWTFDTEGLTQSQIDALQGSRVSVDLVWELQSNDA
ncbi:hypothetical protein CK505_16840 [Kocuria sp. WN036]|uniref:hypothetical protein n=1 Tax=Kocuria sp. WN036 TaxID=2032628 RepID=UPI000BAB9073|nr:hypothetical protein [Kocuria sp. WN036]PAU85826.1 hypothetical protein CK505_16840 [Kocuria sp. WN036]